MIMKSKLTIAILSITGVLFLLLLFIAKTAIYNLFTGKAHLPKEHIGDVLVMDDKQPFEIFRHLKVDSKADDKSNSAVFIVRFKFKNFSIDKNKKLSIIPTPFLTGIKGFRAKFWTINKKTNTFQGIYQWSSKETAEKYPDTFIFKLMTKRATPGTVSYEILPKTGISEFIKLHIQAKANSMIESN